MKDFVRSHKVCPAGAATVLGGGAGAIGDIIERLVITLNTLGATGVVTITDGVGTPISIASATTPVGLYSVMLNVTSRTGAWTVTTLAGATVLAVGSFNT